MSRLTIEQLQGLLDLVRTYKSAGIERLALTRALRAEIAERQHPVFVFAYHPYQARPWQIGPENATGFYRDTHDGFALVHFALGAAIPPEGLWRALPGFELGAQEAARKAIRRAVVALRAFPGCEDLAAVVAESIKARPQTRGKSPLLCYEPERIKHLPSPPVWILDPVQRVRFASDFPC